jgi:hypothetical protein
MTEYSAEIYMVRLSSPQNGSEEFWLCHEILNSYVGECPFSVQVATRLSSQLSLSDKKMLNLFRARTIPISPNATELLRDINPLGSQHVDEKVCGWG